MQEFDSEGKSDGRQDGSGGQKYLYAIKASCQGNQHIHEVLLKPHDLQAHFLLELLKVVDLDFFYSFFIFFIPYHYSGPQFCLFPFSFDQKNENQERGDQAEEGDYYQKAQVYLLVEVADQVVEVGVEKGSQADHHAAAKIQKLKDEQDFDKSQEGLAFSLQNFAQEKQG